MRNIIFILLCTCAAASGQGNNYNTAMQNAVTAMDSAGTAGQFIAAANTFQRIALAEKNAWLPYYYAAYARTNAALVSDSKNSMDELLDIAQNDLEKADSLQPANSEIYAVQGLIYSTRIIVNPMLRGKKYGQQSNTYLQKAIEADTSNPRPYYLLGNNLFYTPPQFGGSKEEACRLYEQSKEKFDLLIVPSALAPHWGKQELEKMLKNCTESAITR